MSTLIIPRSEESFALTIRRAHFDLSCEVRLSELSLKDWERKNIAYYCPLAFAAREAYAALHSNLYAWEPPSVAGLFIRVGGKLWVAKEGESRLLHVDITEAFDQSDGDRMLSLLARERRIEYVRPGMWWGAK